MEMTCRRAFFEFFEVAGYPMPSSEEWHWFYMSLKKEMYYAVL